MKIRAILLSMLLTVFLIGCGEDKEQQQSQTGDQPQMEAAQAGHKATVSEVKQANSYTYLKVSENGKENWIAVRKGDYSEGETVFYMQGMEMKDFKSDDLNRTFDKVYFVQNISKEPMGGGKMNKEAVKKELKSAHGSVKPEADESISVSLAEGGITIAELFDNRKKYNGKSVKIKGKVVKTNFNIMNRNWIHVQDGTGEGQNYDLTVTSKEKASVGDIVTAKGKITLNKDFGSGYKYDIIMEQAIVQKN